MGTLRSINVSANNWGYIPSHWIQNWNMTIQEFLKYHINLKIVDRTKPRHERQLAPFLGTFFCSMFFHGFFHGLHSFFIGVLLNEASIKMFSQTKLAHYL